MGTSSRLILASCVHVQRRPGQAPANAPPFRCWCVARATKVCHRSRRVCFERVAKPNQLRGCWGSVDARMNSNALLNKHTLLHTCRRRGIMPQHGRHTHTLEVLFSLRRACRPLAACTAVGAAPAGAVVQRWELARCCAAATGVGSATWSQHRRLHVDVRQVTRAQG